MHIFLTGDVQVGKSTIINKTLAALKIERPGGFRSVSVPDLPDGAMSVYLLAAAEKAPAMGDFNRVGIRKGCGRGIEKFPQAFETAGVQALKNAEQSRLILMDEVGRMESAAAQFSARMEALLDGSVPILGVVQKIADTPLTNAIRTHPNVQRAGPDDRFCRSNCLPGRYGSDDSRGQPLVVSEGACGARRDAFAGGIARDARGDRHRSGASGRLSAARSLGAGGRPQNRLVLSGAVSGR